MCKWCQILVVAIKSDHLVDKQGVNTIDENLIILLFGIELSHQQGNSFYFTETHYLSHLFVRHFKADIAESFDEGFRHAAVVPDSSSCDIKYYQLYGAHVIRGFYRKIIGR